MIERALPDKDIEQIFEPAYEWGRERRKLNENGRYSETPETDQFIYDLVSLFNFFAYSMATSRISEVATLRNQIVEEGFERGLRKYNLRNGRDYVDYNVDINVTIEKRESMQNHKINIDRSIPEQSDEAAAEILDLYHRNKISRSFAQQLWDYHVDKN